MVSTTIGNLAYPLLVKKIDEEGEIVASRYSTNFIFYVFIGYFLVLSCLIYFGNRIFHSG